MQYTEVFQITVAFFRRDIILYKFSKLKDWKLSLNKSIIFLK